MSDMGLFIPDLLQGGPVRYFGGPASITVPAPTAPGSTAFIPPATLPPPATLTPSAACPNGYGWNGSQCVPNSVSALPPTEPVTIQTANGPVAVAADPSTGQLVSSIPATGPLPPGAGYQQIEEPGAPFPYVFIGAGAAPQQQPQCPSGYQWNGLTCASLAVPSVSNDPQFPNWETQNPPGGSYAQSCQQIQTDGQGNLWALCQTESGQWVQTSLNYLACQSAPYNNNGQLGCGGSGGSQLTTPASGSSQLSPYSGFGTALPWVSSQGYNAGQMVSYGGITWIALAPSQGIPPGSLPGYWMQNSTLPATQYTPAYNAYQFAQQPTSAAALAAAAASASSSGSSLSSFFSTYKWWIVGGLAGLVVVPRLMKK